MRARVHARARAAEGGGGEGGVEDSFITRGREGGRGEGKLPGVPPRGIPGVHWRGRSSKFKLTSGAGN